jgi:hypothetical protein
MNFIVTDYLHPSKRNQVNFKVTKAGIAEKIIA